MEVLNLNITALSKTVGSRRWLLLTLHVPFFFSPLFIGEFCSIQLFKNVFLSPFGNHKVSKPT